MFSKIYRGSVKDVLGPVQASANTGGNPSSNPGSAVIFDYSDAYSVFDWGRMPDLLPKKGEALAILAAHWFEKMERSETWKEFSKSSEALELRKSNRFGAAFNEVGEKLQSEGLRTHYLGVLQSIQGADQPGANVSAVPLSDLSNSVRYLVAKQVSVVKPTFGSVLGRMVPDYQQMRETPLPRLIPLEVVFRFACPPGSSLIDRVQHDPDYLPSRGFGGVKVEPGEKWGFPILEMFTKLETSDRPVSLGELLAISSLSASQLQEVFFKTAWVGGLLKYFCAKNGLTLADGKLEWALGPQGETYLVDAVGPDELRILKDGVQLSKEFLRTFYRTTPWYELMNQAKKTAAHQGSAEWKKLVTMPPPALPTQFKEAATHLYAALTNRLTGRTWFSQAWDLEKVISTLKELSR